MSRVLVTRRGREDMLAIWAYIAADDPAAADRVLDAIDRRCRALADKPALGRTRPDIAPGLRYSPVGSYLIFYRQVDEGVEVVRVLHGARNALAIFQAEE
jgi:toxin ParE1/3/4